MLKGLSVLLLIVCAASSLSAKTVSIGSVVARGDLRIDGHPAQGSGTVFDGTRVQTGSELDSIADFRLSDGTTITLHNNSSGTLYKDHFVLASGEADMSAPDSFRVETGGLIIRGSEPRTTEVIAVGTGGTVSVLAKTGQVHIEGHAGLVRTEIHPQETLALTRNSDGSWKPGKASSQAFDDHDRGDDDDRDWRHRHRHHHQSR